VLGVVLLTLGATTALAPPVSADEARSLLTYSCRGGTPIGVIYGYAYQDVAATAPPTVQPGGQLSVVITPAPNRLPTHVYNRTLLEIGDITIRVPVPDNAALQEATLTGGSGYTGTATVTRDGHRRVVIRIPGTITAGGEFVLPQLTLRLTAGYWGTIRTTLAGFDFRRPQLSFTASVRGLGGGTAAVGAQCHPRPNTVLTSTRIGVAGSRAVPVTRLDGARERS